MIEGLPDVPPAVLLLAQEVPTCSSWEEMRRRVKGMLRELRDQSEVFALESATRNDDSMGSARFEVHLHGALDLLSGDGCCDPGCRFSAADRIARSVGLIADRVWLSDFLSERFVDFGRPTNAKLDEVIVDVTVLVRLLPLIQAGVVRFRSPWTSTCSSCATYFDKRVKATAEDVARVFGTEFRMEKRPDGGFNAETGKCTEPSMVIASATGGLKRLPSARSFAKRWASEQVRTALWKAREASLTGGAVLSNSRIGLAGLLQHDGRLVDMRTLLLLDRERDFSVPWVSELDASR